jgi:CRP/FNR family cyclic AMP-dependent transcriptional regulator
MPSFEIFSREPDLRGFRTGDTIFRAGDRGDCMFVVVEGDVEIHVNGVVVERLQAGSIFGEMALIDAEPRSGTAIAATDCKLAAIGEKRFLRLIEQTPRFALQIMRVVTERLRRRVPH